MAPQDVLCDCRQRGHKGDKGDNRPGRKPFELIAFCPSMLLCWFNQVEAMNQKKDQAVPNVASPFSTGGGGYRFELLVAVHYLIALMRQEFARGTAPGVVQEVRFQQRIQGCPVDDLVILTKSSNDTRCLYLSVKHSITFGENELFYDVMKQMWQQLQAPDFHRECDRLALAIGETCNNKTIKGDVSDLLEWAKTSSTPSSFYGKAKKFSAKTFRLFSIIIINPLFYNFL